MGRHINFDGLVYCDWRINVRNCVDEEFFFHVLAYSTVGFFLALIITLVVIFFRAFILQESFRTYGPNQILTIFMSSIFCLMMNGMLLLFGNNTVATAVFWALAFPIGILSYACYAYFLMLTFQGQTNTKLITSPKVFRIIVLFFGIELTTIFVFLLGFSEYWNTLGDFETSNTLFIAAFSFFSGNLMIFLPYYIYCSIIILKMIGKRELQVNQNIKLVLFKAKQNLLAMLTTGSLVSISFFSMAIDNHFFQNLPLSKICCVFLSLNSIFAFILSSIYLGTDIKKKLAKRQYSSKSHSQSKTQTESIDVEAS